MGEAKYILKIKEGVLVPKEKKNSTDIVRIIIGCISAILIIGSFVFGKNLFEELNTFTKIFLIGLFIKFVILTDVKVDVPSPMELIFFEDHFLVYRPKIWRGKNCIRRETDAMRYDQVTRIKYISESRRFHIYGTFTGKYYKYNKKDILQDTPCYDKTVKDGMIFFSTRCTEENDDHIIEILCTYIPNKLEIR